MDNTQKIIKQIKNNERLLSFCEQVITFRNILESDVRYLYLVSLVSADTLLTIEDCEKSLEKLNFLKTNIDLIETDDYAKKETIKYVNKALKIVKRDLKEFNKNNNNQK